MKKVTFRNVLASGVVTALVLTGASFQGGVADAATKTKTTHVVKKKTDYKKYRAKQLKAVASYDSTLFHMDRFGGIKVPDYVTDPVYRAQVERYNKKVESYKKDYAAAVKEVKALKKFIPEVNTAKEKKITDRRVAALKKETARLKAKSKALLKQGQALYKVITDYEQQQILSFESRYGSISEALTLISYRDYLTRLDNYLTENHYSKDAKAAIIDLNSERMLNAREESSERLGDTRGKMFLLIYAGKFEEANELFTYAKDTIVVEENARLDALYTKIIERYMKK